MDRKKRNKRKKNNKAKLRKQQTESESTPESLQEKKRSNKLMRRQKRLHRAENEKPTCSFENEAGETHMTNVCSSSSSDTLFKTKVESLNTLLKNLKLEMKETIIRLSELDFLSEDSDSQNKSRSSSDTESAKQPLKQAENEKPTGSFENEAGETHMANVSSSSSSDTRFKTKLEALDTYLKNLKLEIKETKKEVKRIAGLSELDFLSEDSDIQNKSPTSSDTESAKQPLKPADGLMDISIKSGKSNEFKPLSPIDESYMNYKMDLLNYMNINEELNEDDENINFISVSAYGSDIQMAIAASCVTNASNSNDSDNENNNKQKKKGDEGNINEEDAKNKYVNEEGAEKDETIEDEPVSFEFLGNSDPEESINDEASLEGACNLEYQEYNVQKNEEFGELSDYSTE